MRAVLVAVLALAIVGCNKPLELSTGPSGPGASSPPTIHTFSADATRLGGPNGPVLDTFLRWDVTGPADTHCFIDSLGPPLQVIGNVPLGGVVQVRPQVSRDYRLACTSTGGTATRYVSILVG